MAIDASSNPSSQGPVDADLGQLISTLQSAVQAVNNMTATLNLTLETIFPQQGGLSTSAVAGVRTLPSNPTAFLTITVNDVAYKVPLYS